MKSGTQLEYANIDDDGDDGNDDDVDGYDDDVKYDSPQYGERGHEEGESPTLDDRQAATQAALVIIIIMIIMVMMSISYDDHYDLVHTWRRVTRPETKKMVEMMYPGVKV